MVSSCRGACQKRKKPTRMHAAAIKSHCVRTCVWVYMCVLCIYVCIYIYIYINIYVCVFACMSTRSYASVCVSLRACLCVCLTTAKAALLSAATHNGLNANARAAADIQGTNPLGAIDFVARAVEHEGCVWVLVWERDKCGKQKIANPCDLVHYTRTLAYSLAHTHTNNDAHSQRCKVKAYLIWMSHVTWE